MARIDSGRCSCWATSPSCGSRRTSSTLQRRLAPDHLHRLGQALPEHGGAQDVVAVDDGLQRVQEAIQPLATVEAQ